MVGFFFLEVELLVMGFFLFGTGTFGDGFFNILFLLYKFLIKYRSHRRGCDEQWRNQGWQMSNCPFHFELCPVKFYLLRFIY